MSDYDKADRECEAIQKRHGPGGELPPECYYPRPNNKAGAACVPANRQKGDLEKVKSLALGIVPYALASSVIFWWQQSGQLAEDTGFWALIALALLGGVSIGRCLRNGQIQ